MRRDGAATRGDLVRSGLEQHRHTGLRIGTLAMVHARADEVARKAALDEDDVAARGARDAGAAEGERLDAQRQLIADAGRAERSASLGSREQPLEQRLLRVAAVLRLVPDPLALPVEHLGGDLLAGVGREVVQRDRVRDAARSSSASSMR